MKEYTPEQLETRRRRALEWNKAHPQRVKDNNARLYRLRKAKGIKQPLQNKERNREYARRHKKKCPWAYSMSGAKARCNNPRHPSYKYYGGKGIKFLLNNKDFRYMWIRDKAAFMDRPSIDRIDPDGDYTLDNCRFLTLSENSRRRAYRELQRRGIKVPLGIDPKSFERL